MKSIRTEMKQSRDGLSTIGNVITSSVSEGSRYATSLLRGSPLVRRLLRRYTRLPQFQKARILFTISTVIGTLLFLGLFDCLFRLLSYSMEQPEVVFICSYTTAYLISVMWQHALNRWLVFPTTSYCASLFQTYIVYSFSLMLMTLLGAMLVRSLSIEARVVTLITLPTSGILNYYLLALCLNPKRQSKHRSSRGGRGSKMYTKKSPRIDTRPDLPVEADNLEPLALSELGKSSEAEYIRNLERRHSSLKLDSSDIGRGLGKRPSSVGGVRTSPRKIVHSYQSSFSNDHFPAHSSVNLSFSQRTPPTALRRATAWRGHPAASHVENDQQIESQNLDKTTSATSASPSLVNTGGISDIEYLASRPASVPMDVQVRVNLNIDMTVASSPSLKDIRLSFTHPALLSRP